MQMMDLVCIRSLIQMENNTSILNVKPSGATESSQLSISQILKLLSHYLHFTPQIGLFSQTPQLIILHQAQLLKTQS